MLSTSVRKGCLPIVYPLSIIDSSIGITEIKAMRVDIANRCILDIFDGDGLGVVEGGVCLYLHYREDF